MSQKPRAAAVVLAGGSGERFGREGGKQLALVAGRPVLWWTLRAFDDSSCFDYLVVVCPSLRRDEYDTLAVAPAKLKTPVLFADSGASRQNSAISGMSVLPDSVEVIAVHDGARPLVTPQAIADCVDRLVQTGAHGVVLGNRVVDTLKLVEGDRVTSTPDRSQYWVAQTPQVFRREALARAFDFASESGFTGTDDSAAVEHAGGSIVMVEGPRDNIKVTHAEDVAFVESVLTCRLGKGDSCE